MGILVPLHGRASCAANRIKSSPPTPHSVTRRLRRTTAHHSGGMVLRCHHFEIIQAVARRPAKRDTSSAIASRDGHSSMIERNDAADMGNILGQTVLKCKAKLSYDTAVDGGQNVPMSRSDFKTAFIARTAAARNAAGLTQQQVADALQIEQDTYKQYETRSPLPHYLVPAFCLATGTDPAKLFGISTRKRSVA